MDKQQNEVYTHTLFILRRNALRKDYLPDHQLDENKMHTRRQIIARVVQERGRKSKYVKNHVFRYGAKTNVFRPHPGMQLNIFADGSNVLGLYNMNRT